MRSKKRQNGGTDNNFRFQLNTPPEKVYWPLKMKTLSEKLSTFSILKMLQLKKKRKILERL